MFFLLCCNCSLYIYDVNIWLIFVANVSPICHVSFTFWCFYSHTEFVPNLLIFLLVFLPLLLSFESHHSKINKIFTYIFSSYWKLWMNLLLTVFKKTTEKYNIKTEVLLFPTPSLLSILIHGRSSNFWWFYFLRFIN